MLLFNSYLFKLDFNTKSVQCGMLKPGVGVGVGGCEYHFCDRVNGRKDIRALRSFSGSQLGG